MNYPYILHHHVIELSSPGPRPGMVVPEQPDPTATTSMPPVDPNLPQPCDDGHVDAIVMFEDHTVYAFRDDYYIRILDNGIAPFYPRSISEFEGLVMEQGGIDAAVTFDAKYRYVYDSDASSYIKERQLEERLFIFQGDQVYLYQSSSKSLSPGFPKPISETFPGLPDNIDAAFRWSGNGKTYFIKGNENSLNKNIQLALKFGKR